MAKSKSTERRDKDFLKKPYYEGGLKAIREFIAQNMKYPDKALKKKVEGTVHVKYSVDHTGKVIKAKSISGIGLGCDEEAVRIVKLLKFKVDKIRKMRVVFNKSIKINFKLPKEKTISPPKVSKSIAYTMTSKKKKDVKEAGKSPKKGNSYSYTIKF